MAFADLLKEARVRAGLSQKTLAKKVGVSVQAYQKWEYGDAMPAASRREALAAALGISVHDLILLETNTDKREITIPFQTVTREERAAPPGGWLNNDQIERLAREPTGTFYLPSKFFKNYDPNKPAFAMIALNDFLESAGISPGDTLVVNPNEKIAQGAVALAYWYGVYVFYRCFKIGDDIVLRNDASDRRLTKEEQEAGGLKFLGPVAAIIKARPACTAY